MILRMRCGAGSWGDRRWLFYTDGDAEGDFLEKFHADLAEGPATVVPVDDVDGILLVRDFMDGVQDDKVRRKAAFEFIMVLFMEVGIIYIEIGDTGANRMNEVVI